MHGRREKYARDEMFIYLIIIQLTHPLVGKVLLDISYPTILVVYLHTFGDIFTFTLEFGSRTIS